MQSRAVSRVVVESIEQECDPSGRALLQTFLQFLEPYVLEDAPPSVVIPALRDWFTEHERRRISRLLGELIEVTSCASR